MCKVQYVKIYSRKLTIKSYCMKLMTVCLFETYEFVRALQETDRMEFIYSKKDPHKLSLETLMTNILS